MVFPSHLPVNHLDPPNWQQQQGGGVENHHHHQLPPPPPPIGGVGHGSIRPGSMSERARLAKIPQPEKALKCPRCESTNTKFCYFNNYSLSQPRHFCKTCRRYWTIGGALRSVPVGGGCRRNKRSSKRSRSKSPSIGQSINSSSTSGISNSNTSCTTSHDLLGHNLPYPSHLQFFSPLHNLTHDFGNVDIGLNFCGIQPTRNGCGGNEIQELLQIGNNGTSVVNSVTPLNMSARFADQWKLQQFPNFLSGMEQQQQQTSGTYHQFEGELSNYVGGTSSDQLGSKIVKLEDHTHRRHHQELQNNFTRNLSSVNVGGNDHYWSGNTWTDDLSCSTSTAGHLI